MPKKQTEFTDLDEAFVSVVQELLDEKGMSIRALARAIDLPHTRFSRAMRLERSFFYNEVKMIAEAFDMKTSELVKLAEDRLVEEVEPASAVAVVSVVDDDAVVFGEGDGRLADNGDDVDDVLAVIEEARRSGVGLAALEMDPRLVESEDFFD